MGKIVFHLTMFLSGALVLFPAGTLSAAPHAPEKEASTALDQATVQRFLVEQLTMIARRKESVFDALSDDRRLLGSEWTRKALKYDPKDAAFWRRVFPGYDRLRADQLRGLRVQRLDGKVRVTLLRLAGGTEQRPVWQDVPAVFVLARVRIPGRREETCTVYLAEGRLYWQPFGW